MTSGDLPDLPDHSTCRHCKRPISWGEHCYTHDHSGDAECNSSGLSFGSHIDHLKSAADRVRAEPIESVRGERS